jgi:uncharacterized membrane protein
MSDPGPYYRPPGMRVRQRPGGIRWLPIVIAVVFVAAAALLLLLLLYPASFGLAPSSYPDHFGVFGGAFFLFLILLIGFFIVRVAFWGTRASRYGGRYGPGNSPGYGQNRPAMVARMRYARGEITREQYDQIMDGLSRRPGSP